jgi:hypothetical protein
MLIKLSTWLCLEIRVQDEGTSVKTVNISFERVEEFETTLRNQNFIQEEIKRVKSRNACYLSVHNLGSSSLISKTKHHEFIFGMDDSCPLF